MNTIHWWETRKQRIAYESTEKGLKEISGFLKDLTLSGIDEKIAMMNLYSAKAKIWKPPTDEKHKRLRESRIEADLMSLTRVQRVMTNDQRVSLMSALKSLISALEPTYDTTKIEAMLTLLSSARPS